MSSKEVEKPYEEQVKDAMADAKSGAEQMAKVLMELSVKACPIVDRLTSSSLKKVLKRILFYPHRPEYFQDMNLIPRDKLSPSEEELYGLGTATKDAYSDMLSFCKQAELLEKRLGETEEKEDE